MALQFEPEQLWDDVLSRDDQRIRLAWERMNAAERMALIAHLERMTSEEGWHEEQVISAQKALASIHRVTGMEKEDHQ